MEKKQDVHLKVRTDLPPFQVTGKGGEGGRILYEVECFGFNHTYFLND